MERPRRLALSTALALIVAAGVGWWRWREPGHAPRPPIPGETVHLSVEVLNGTNVDGLAREVTRRLRQGGIDVVSFGSAGDTALDTTTILVRRGDSSAVLRVRRVLGAGRVVVRPDPRLLLDASVLVGRDLAALLGLHP